jgi:hypothetical protein
MICLNIAWFPNSVLSYDLNNPAKIFCLLRTIIQMADKAMKYIKPQVFDYREDL